MEKLISKQLLNKVTSGSLNESRSIFSKAKDTRDRSKYSYEVSIFLSHKHSEKDIIEKVIVLLDKFILLATEGAIASKWCNWELGIGDVHKYYKNMAVMPITNKENGEFSGNEYLQIYPIITSEYYYTTGTYYVEFEGNKIKLEEWIKQK